MKPIVVDASTVVEYLLRSSRDAGLEEALRDPELEVHIPALCDIEVCSVVRRGLLSRRISRSRSWDAIEDYLDLPLTRHGHTRLLGRVLRLRENFSAYDATYVALAERLGAGLLTADEALARSVLRHLDLPLL